MRQHRSVIVLACGMAACLLGASARRAAALEVGIESNSAPPSASVSMCVYMSGGQDDVAGIQMQLRWDGDCTSIVPATDRAALCTSLVPGKTLSTAIGTRSCNGDPNCLTGLLVSLTDTDPFADQELFCCSFIVAAQPPRTSCPFTLSNVIASDPRGRRVVNVQTLAGALTILLPPASGVSASHGASNGGGCAIAPRAGSRGGLLVLVGLVGCMALRGRHRRRTG